MKYTNVLTLVLALGISPLFAMEHGYNPEIKPNASRTTPRKNEATKAVTAFTVSAVINEFNTPVTVLNLKETNSITGLAGMNKQHYVYEISPEIIKDCSIIFPGTEEAHKLQESFAINYPIDRHEYTSLVIIAADKFVKIRVGEQTIKEKTLRLTEMDHTGKSEKFAEIAFNNGDSFVVKVARDGKVTLEKSAEKKAENKQNIEDKNAENKQVAEAKQIELTIDEKQIILHGVIQDFKNIQKAGPQVETVKAVNALIQKLMETEELYKQTIGTQEYAALITQLLEAIEKKNIYDTAYKFQAACEETLKELTTERLKQLLKK